MIGDDSQFTFDDSIDPDEKKAQPAKKSEKDKGGKYVDEMWSRVNKSASKHKRKELKKELKGDNPHHDKGEEEQPMESSDETAEFKDPFAEAPKPKLDKKALDDKALDKVKNVKEDKEKETKDAEEMKQAKEKKEAEIIDVKAEDIEVKSPETKLAGHVEPVTLENETGKGEFRSEFWEILAQAGFTKGRIFGGFIAIVVLVLILIFFVFGSVSFSGIFGIFSGSDSEEEQVDEVDEDNEQEPEIIPEVDDAGIVTSFFLGFQDVFEDTLGLTDTVTLSFDLGQDFPDSGVRFVEQVNFLRELQSLYFTDVYNLLDLSLDRRAAIDTFLRRMDIMIIEGETIFFEIEAEMERINAEFALITAESDLLEEQFFANVEELLGEQSYQDLNNFIELGNEAGVLKAQFEAYKTLRGYYVNTINAIKPRRDDIALNKEAIIKGIRVFDVPDSDIDAIIPLEN